MATSVLLSVEEYLQLEPREDGLDDELIQGEIVLSPSAKPLHAKVVARLFEILKPLEALGYARATDFGCILGKHSLPGPDLAAIRAERWRSVGEDDYLVGSPELVVEVFSPSNRKALMAQKAALYLQHGAEAVWVVYPKQRTLMVHEAESQTEARCGETVSFHGVVIPVTSIFEGL
ncbi:MAG TPA: Uma2 family endonuclease [Bryobacteraceae bacterium]|nr:Uma2 family endonuclease [Bryobacteraceae bacterium]